MRYVLLFIISELEIIGSVVGGSSVWCLPLVLRSCPRFRPFSMVCFSWTAKALLIFFLWGFNTLQLTLKSQRKIPLYLPVWQLLLTLLARFHRSCSAAKIFRAPVRGHRDKRQPISISLAERKRQLWCTNTPKHHDKDLYRLTLRVCAGLLVYMEADIVGRCMQTICFAIPKRCSLERTWKHGGE